MISTHLKIVAVIYILFSLLEVLRIVLTITKSKKLTIMNMCSVMYIAMLCAVPALMFLGYEGGETVENGIKFKDSVAWTFYVQCVLTIVGYFFFRFGYCIKQKKLQKRSKPRQQQVLLTAFALTFIGMVSLFLWASGYGGIKELLIHADWIRGGWVTSTNSLTFFKHFLPMALLSSWLLFFAYVRGEFKGAIEKALGALLFAFSVVISVVYIRANDGRILLAVYGFVFFAIFVKYKYENKSLKTKTLMFLIGAFSVAAALVLFNGDAIFEALKGTKGASTQNGSNTELIDRLYKEFSFIVSGSQCSVMQQASEGRRLLVWNDVINGLFAWLPTSLKPVVLEDVWDYNTRILNTGSYGQSPTSIVAQSVYDLGFAGIAVIPFLYGMLVKKAEALLDRHKDSVFYGTLYVVVAWYLCKGIPYFSIYNIMLNTFFIFVSVFVYKMLSKIRV